MTALHIYIVVRQPGLVGSSPLCAAPFAPRRESVGESSLRSHRMPPGLNRSSWLGYGEHTSTNGGARTTKQKAKDAKTLKLNHTIAEARRLWASNKTHHYLKLVNQLTPKTHVQRPQLRQHQGLLMSPQEELDWISLYMKDIYKGTDLSLPPFQLDSLPFQAQDMTRALQDLSSRTGVPPHIAPSFVQWRSHGLIPLEWRRGWVVLLPKPHKPPTEPKALRPIALQTPLSKTVMSLFAHFAKLHALPGLIWYPQFAYLPGRGTWEAITRVTAHVREVQTLLARWKYDANSTVRGNKVRVYGGCQLFLDLTGAFDAMPREHLWEAFRLLNLPEDLVLLLLTWHTETAYIVQWKGLEAEQATFRRIRQGCRGAPFFGPASLHWSLSTWQTRLMFTGCGTTAHFMLMMVMLALFFTTWKNFTEVLDYNFGRLIDILERLGMTVNMSKSAAIIQWRGSFRPQATKAYVTQSQHETYLKIPKRHTLHYEIPLREHQDYLGISIGYKQVLQGTMQKRLKACAHRHRQMKTWFCKHLCMWLRSCPCGKRVSFQ